MSLREPAGYPYYNRGIEPCGISQNLAQMGVVSALDLVLD